MKYEIGTNGILKTGVYIIINTVTNAIYVGSTSNDFKYRYWQHLNLLRKGRHHSKYLQRSWNNHKSSSFEFRTIAECPPSYCLKLEQWFIDTIKPVYNNTAIAGSLLGYRHPINSKTRTVVRGNHHSAVPVDQYSLDGKLIRSFDCVGDACFASGVVSNSNIIQCCKGLVFSAGKFRWSYKNKPLISRSKREGGKHRIALKRVDGFYQEFDSQKAAAEYIVGLGHPCNQARIHRSVFKTNERVYGFNVIKL